MYTYKDITTHVHSCTVHDVHVTRDIKTVRLRHTELLKESCKKSEPSWDVNPGPS